ncbi:MAG: dockerin type I domain-containing protein [Planctomycetota bacterium]
MQQLRIFLLFAATVGAWEPPRLMAFDLQFSIVDSGGQFTTNERHILDAALARAERMWETVITGYQPNIIIGSIPISIYPTTSGLAAATYSSTTYQGGFTLATQGFININVNEIENFANWQGVGANGRNYIDELLAHEVGHVLGVGTLWVGNGVYATNTYHYTGVYGLAAYQAEFNQTVAFVPVENAGNPGTPNAHWDQLMRSSPQEGNPSNPWSLDPRVGVVDQYGRDRGLELMSGAIDPDYGEPFLSRFTVESMRDLGYTVTAFEDFNGDGAVDLLDRAILLNAMGATGLEIDSIAFGDANRDRMISEADLVLWQTAAGVPEPGSLAPVGVALMGWGLRRHRRVHTPAPHA